MYIHIFELESSLLCIYPYISKCISQIHTRMCKKRFKTLKLETTQMPSYSNVNMYSGISSLWDIPQQ